MKVVSVVCIQSLFACVVCPVVLSGASTLVGSPDAHVEGVLRVEDPNGVGGDGVSISYFDYDATPDPDQPAQVYFRVNQALAEWLWTMNTDGADITQMTLDDTNTLELYDASGNVKILLDPTVPEILVGGKPVVLESAAGGLYLSGNYNSNDDGSSFPAVNSSTLNQLVWYEPSGAFFAGRNSSDIWASNGIGNYSVTFGIDSDATGDFSFVHGAFATASGPYSYAHGNNSTASGTTSTARGWYALATGDYAFAYGRRYSEERPLLASGLHSVAFGRGSQSTADYSVSFGVNVSNGGSYAIGVGNGHIITGPLSATFGLDNTNSSPRGFIVGSNDVVTGVSSAALGRNLLVEGDYSIAFNRYTSVAGDQSVAMGSNTSADSYASVAIGRYNVGKDSAGASPNPTAWVAKDPVFEVGVGTSEEAKNAMTVYKDGSTEFSGRVTLSQAQGDISMGIFGN